MRILRLVLVALLVAILADWPVTTYGAVVACSTSGCTTFRNALNNNTLSTSVINDAAKSWATVFNAVQTGTLATTQLSEAKANLQTLFDYLNSYGWVDYMNQALAAVRSNLTANGQTPTDSQVTTVYNGLIADGFAVTQAQVRNALTVTAAQAQQFYAELSQLGGWSGVENQTVQAASNTVIQSGGGRPVLEESVGHPGLARLVNVAFCAVAAEAYGGVAFYAAVAAELGAAIFAGPAVLVVAGIGLAFGGLDIFGVC